MKKYQCHKRVQASQIVEINHTTHPEEPETDMVDIHIDDGTILIFRKDDKIIGRYMPVVGDYMVLYRDGYLSISPQKEFEDGYSEIFDEVEMDAPAKFLRAMKGITDEGTQAWSGGWISPHDPGMFYLTLDGKELIVNVRDRVASSRERIDELTHQGSYNSLGSINNAEEGTELKQINLRWVDRDHSKVLQYQGQVMRNNFWEEAWFDVPTAMETPING